MNQERWTLHGCVFSFRFMSLGKLFNFSEVQLRHLKNWQESNIWFTNLWVLYIYDCMTSLKYQAYFDYWLHTYFVTLSESIMPNQMFEPANKLLHLVIQRNLHSLLSSNIFSSLFYKIHDRVCFCDPTKNPLFSFSTNQMSGYLPDIWILLINLQIFFHKHQISISKINIILCMKKVWRTFRIIFLHMYSVFWKNFFAVILSLHWKNKCFEDIWITTMRKLLFLCA